MSAGPEKYVTRECAQEIIALFNKHRDDAPRLSDGIRAATRRLLDRADLTTLGAKRQGNFVSNSRYLYYLESAEFWVTSWRPVTCARSRQATAR